MRADLVAADKKYLKNKANEVAKILQDEVSEVLVKLQEKVVSMFDEAAEGKQMKFDVKAELAEITAKINDLQKIAQAINLAVGSEGIPELVERWRGLPEIIEKQRGLRKSYRLENLLSAIKEVKDRRDKDK
jgi:phage terminase Nu1 subunit (DNA packaging protein)